jgi:hypothetical protein
MAGLKIRVEDFEDGALPPVCVVTGRPAEVLHRFELTSPQQRREGLLWWFIGGPLGLLALWWTRSGRSQGGVVGYLPLTEEAAEGSRLQGPSGGVFVVGGFGCLLLALLAAPSDALGGMWVLLVGLGFALLVVGLVVAARRDATIPGGEVDESGRWVTVWPASPAFAEAYEAQERGRRSQRQEEAAQMRLPRSG